MDWKQFAANGTWILTTDFSTDLYAKSSVPNAPILSNNMPYKDILWLIMGKLRAVHRVVVTSYFAPKLLSYPWCKFMFEHLHFKRTNIFRQCPMQLLPFWISIWFSPPNEGIPFWIAPNGAPTPSVDKWLIHQWTDIPVQIFCHHCLLRMPGARLNVHSDYSSLRFSYVMLLIIFVLTFPSSKF